MKKKENRTRFLPFNKNTQEFVGCCRFVLMHFLGEAFTRGIFPRLFPAISPQNWENSLQYSAAITIFLRNKWEMTGVFLDERLRFCINFTVTMHSRTALSFPSRIALFYCCPALSATSQKETEIWSDCIGITLRFPYYGSIIFIFAADQMQVVSILCAMSGPRCDLPY